jgi:hypothetical protein
VGEEVPSSGSKASFAGKRTSFIRIREIGASVSLFNCTRYPAPNPEVLFVVTATYSEWPSRLSAGAQFKTTLRMPASDAAVAADVHVPMPVLDIRTSPLEHRGRGVAHVKPKYGAIGIDGDRRADLELLL